MEDDECLIDEDEDLIDEALQHIDELEQAQRLEEAHAVAETLVELEPKNPQVTRRARSLHPVRGAD